ncbi:replication initiator protein A [Enterococcus thailandicus]|uniref:Replication initiator protein A n=1 Tax=Enterococcus thailandicus TaxID=417368 RepID=A0A179EU16_ENTTH|nr:replication initiator protein A [Enterococcus thailandicus]OAQ56691.1 replication initiator protein A [Enterococcus thailandicus]
MEEIDNLITQYAYTKDDLYAEKYLQYPIFLDKHEKYKKMKQSSKKVYMYLKKQNEYSLENSKVDKTGRIFLIFTIKKLAEKSCLTEKTVICALRELEEYNLITIKKNGFNKKTRKNNPNFYYLLKPEFNEGDFYKKKTRIEENLHLLPNQRSCLGVKNTPSAKSAFSRYKLVSTLSEKNTLELNHYCKELKDSKESQNNALLNSLTAENHELDELLIESLVEEECLHQIWGDNIVRCLKLAGNGDYHQFCDWYKKFKYAIKSAEKEKKTELKSMYEVCNNMYFVDHVREQLAKTLRDLIRRVKTDHRIEKTADYIFISLKKEAIELIKLQIREEI